MFDSHIREAFLELSVKAGITVASPEGIADLCCGQPWKSKGALEGYRVMSDKTSQWLGRFGKSVPVISDAASCTESLRKLGEIVDIVDFTAEKVLPKLKLRKLQSIAVHPTCASTQSGSNAALMKIAHALSDEVFIPETWGCCAFAGDRGILHPELTKSATQAMAEEINTRAFDAYVSNNRTCEIGMSRATGKRYRHIIELIFDLAE